MTARSVTLSPSVVAAVIRTGLVALVVAGCASAQLTAAQTRGYEIVDRCRAETGITQGNVYIYPDGAWRITDMQASQVASAMACAKKYGGAPRGY